MPFCSNIASLKWGLPEKRQRPLDYNISTVSDCEILTNMLHWGCLDRVWCLLWSFPFRSSGSRLPWGAIQILFWVCYWRIMRHPLARPFEYQLHAQWTSAFDLAWLPWSKPFHSNQWSMLFVTYQCEKGCRFAFWSRQAAIFFPSQGFLSLKWPWFSSRELTTGPLDWPPLGRTWCWGSI